MKQYILLIVLSALCLYGHGQNTNRNYVQTRTFQNETGTTYLDAVDYYDGLGRPVQTVEKKATPAQRDLVTQLEYDAAGRLSHSWLPSPTTVQTSDLVALSTFKTYAWNFYADSAYSRPVYENSPLNRVLEEYGPGRDWYTNKKAVRTTYLTNNASDTLVCRFYELMDNENPFFVRKEDFPTGSLNVIKLDDEEGNTTMEFYNSSGQLLLRRQLYLSSGVKFPYDTYFIYDNRGNLMFVLPPHASDALTASWNVFTEDRVAIKSFGYSYRYDHRNRCIYKRLPDISPIYYRYDDADQLIFTQDGENRKKGEWQFSIPDTQGRVVLTGLCKNTINTNYISGNVTATFNLNQTVTKYYQINGLTLTSPEIMTVQYYDHYDFLSKESFTQLGYDSSQSDYNTRYGDNTASSKYKHSGLLTGSMERIIDESSGSQYLYKAFYYDFKGRLIQQASTTHLTGQIEKEYNKYGFTDELLKQYQVTLINGLQNLTQTFEYTYDHAGRLTRKTHSNSLRSGHQAIINYTYDEGGRLINYNPGTTLQPSLHHYKYTYNVRGWQTGITGSWFMEQLQYAGNGNITTRKWKTSETGKEFQYDYVYDSHSKILEAKSNRGYDTKYSYCKQGNLVSLERFTNYGVTGSEKVQIDRLTYHYEQSNQVRDITEQCGLMPDLYDSNDYIKYPKPSGTGDDYAYDANGSTTRMLNRGITQIQYNHLNLPKLIDIKNPRTEGRNTYSYTSGGEKLRVIRHWNPNYATNPVIGTAPDPNTMTRSYTIDYIGNKRYEEGILIRMMIGEGYFDKYSNDYVFYVKDYQGNMRTNLKANGGRIQSYEYYPFGVSYNYIHSNEPYKYNGKELEHFNVVNLYDYGARMYDPGMARFTTMDPMAEKYYHISPYAYCSNNPINKIDPDGRDEWDLNPKGQIVNHRRTRHQAIFIMNPEKSRSEWQSIHFKGKPIKNVSTPSDIIKERNGSIGRRNMTIFEMNSDYKAMDLFEFLANNTSVEWTHAKIDKIGSNKNIVGTSQRENSSYVGQYLLRQGKHFLREVNHNHPGGHMGASPGDIEGAKEYQKHNRNIYLHIFVSPDTYIPYDHTGASVMFQDIILEQTKDKE